MEDAVLVIIPAFNEEKNIADVVQKTLAQGLEVLVVDDRSTDETFLRAQKAGAKVISLPINLGYAGALQAGYFYARDMKYEYVVQLDGDGQHDPIYCDILLEPLRKNQADVAMGSRFLGQNSYKVPFIRRMGQKLFAALASCWLRIQVTDPTTGFQALTAEVVEVYCTNIFPEDFPDVDLRILLNRMGFQVVEVPVKMNPCSGVSMHSGLFGPVYYCIKMSLALFLAPIHRVSKSRRNRE